SAQSLNESGASPVPVPTVGPVSGVDYAPYVTNQYTHNGRTYSAAARDPRGNMLAGLYGTICPTGLASWQSMVSVLESHGLSSTYVGATWDGVTAALKRGHPVILGTQLTADGHIIVAVGYTADGNLIINDPYGNRFLPGYGGNDGRGVVYPWKRLTARRALEVIGTYPPPPRPTSTTVSTSTATAVPATSTPTSTSAPTDTPPAILKTPSPLPGVVFPTVEVPATPTESVPTPVPIEDTPTPVGDTPVPVEPTPIPTLEENTPVPIERTPFPIEFFPTPTPIVYGSLTLYHGRA
ncbi:MAG TPA: C39 family peptidase, partial [Chloroflexia bacterium]|nr:C39 family peptidase [Chloroflexia bacterium]